jgi:hypothetical protein
VLGEAAGGPRLGAGQRLLLVGAAVQQGGQLVEGEDDVGTQAVLDAHRHLGGEPVGRAVEVAAEGDAVVVDVGETVLVGGDDVGGLGRGVHRQRLAEPGAEAHDLEAAGVGEGRAGPAHEPAEPAGLLHDVVAGLEVQVVGVGEQGLRAELGHRLRQHRLDGGLGADGDEGGRADRAVRGGERAGAAGAVPEAGADLEERRGRGGRVGHGLIQAGDGPCVSAGR